MDISIQISADSRKAVENFEATTSSLTKLRNEFAKTQNSQDGTAASTSALDDSTKRYTDKLQRLAAVMTAGGASAKDLKKVLSTLSNEQLKLLEITDSNSSVDKVFNDLNSYYSGLLNEVELATAAQKSYEDQIKKVSEAEKLQASDQNNLAYYSLIGDDLGKANAQLAIYERQLRNIIETEGASSASAVAMAKNVQNQKNAIDQLSQSASKATPIMQKLFSAFTLSNIASNIISGAVYKLINALKNSTKEAAKAEETYNLFNVIFEKIGDSANRVASELSSSLGLAQSTAKEGLGIFADLAIGYDQSQSAALSFAEAAFKTTLDIISFKNATGDTVEILKAFSSGFVGNYENFRRYGYIITAAEVSNRLAAKGLDKLSGSALQFAKIQEALAIIQEKSATAQGDMIRTLNSTENVSRRVKEQNKALMENLGNSINKVLTPLKKVWLEIAESINKAAEAQRQYESGAKTISVYDLKGNEKDRKSFSKEIGATYGEFLERYGNVSDQRLIEEILRAAITKYNADLNDVVNAFDIPVEKINEEFLNLADQIIETLQFEQKHAQQIEERSMKLEDIASSAMSFSDSALAIKGVKTSVDIGKYASMTDKYTQSDAAVEMLSLAIDNAIQRTISDAIQSLKDADWTEFTDPIENAIGAATESSGLEEKQAAIYSLYELLSNEFSKDGIISQQEADRLQIIADLYAEINEQLEAIEEDEERVNDLKAALEDAQKSNTTYDNDITKIGMSEKDAALFDLSQQRKEALSLAVTEEEIEDINVAFDALENSANKYYQALDKQTRATEAAAAAEELAEKRAEAATAYAEFTQFINESISKATIPNYGKTYEAQEAYRLQFEQGAQELENLAKLWREAKFSEMEISDMLAVEFERVRDAAEKVADELDEESWRSAIDNGLIAITGEIGELVKAASGNGETGDVATDLWSFLFDILAGFEIVQSILSIISDTLVPIADEFLEPLLPIITLTKDFILGISNILKIAFDLIKGPVAAVVYFLGVIYIGIMWVIDAINYAIAWLWNKLVDFIDKILWGNQQGWKINADDPNKKAAERYAELLKTCDAILGETFVIADNTEQSVDTSVYDELLSKGIINANEYRAMVAEALGEKAPDAVSAIQAGESSYVDYRKVGETTQISSSNTTIIINGASMSADEIVRTVVRELKKEGEKNYAFA